MEVKTIAELFPGVKRKGTDLNEQNAFDGVFPWNQIIIERGTFFHKMAMLVKPGWKLIGVARPPYQSGEDNVAIVFEKETPPDPKGDWSAQREPGIWWGHGRVGIKIITKL